MIIESGVKPFIRTSLNTPKIKSMSAMLVGRRDTVEASETLASALVVVVHLQPSAEAKDGQNENARRK